MDDWEKAEDVADVCRMFRGRILDLMHPGSVDAEQNVGVNIPTGQTAPSGNPGVSRFSRMLNETGSSLPSIEELEKQDNQVPPPRNLLFMSILVTIFFFPPSGIVAIHYALKTRRLWKEKPGSDEAGSAKRSAAMWVGITFFLGLIFFAFLIHIH